MSTIRRQRSRRLALPTLNFGRPSLDAGNSPGSHALAQFGGETGGDLPVPRCATGDRRSGPDEVAEKKTNGLNPGNV